MNGYEQTAATLKALAHPVRLQLLQLLAEEGEACVCHLEARLDQRQAYISQQLATLRQAGLVLDRREGLNVFYTLATGGIRRLLADAWELAAAVARAGGADLEFTPIRSLDSDRCPCPSCEQRQPVGAAGE